MMRWQMAALMAVGMAATPAAAGSGAEGVEVRIATHGLNLSTAEGQARFLARAAHAARAACAADVALPRGGGLMLSEAERTCREQVVTAAAERLGPVAQLARLP